jgi:hypothetical protein
MIYKILHRKLKIEHMNSTRNKGWTQVLRKCRQLLFRGAIALLLLNNTKKFWYVSRSHNNTFLLDKIKHKYNITFLNLTDKKG